MKVAVTVALVGALLTLVDLGEVARLLRAMDPRLFIAAVVVGLLDRFIMALKWLPLARVLVPSLRFSTALRAYLASTLAGFFLPSSVGGDVLRTIGVGRTTGGEAARIGASVVLERVLGLFGSGALSLTALIIAMSLGLDLEVLIPWAVAAFLAPIVMLTITWHPKAVRLVARVGGRVPLGPIRRFTERMTEGYHQYRGHRRLVALVGLASILEQLVPIVALSFLAAALDTRITPLMLLVAQPLAAFASRLPIAIWSLGVSEGAAIFLLGLFGVPAAEAFALVLSGRIIEVIAVLPGALFWQDLVGSAVAGRPSS